MDQLNATLDVIKTEVWYLTLNPNNLFNQRVKSNKNKTYIVTTFGTKLIITDVYLFLCVP